MYSLQDDFEETKSIFELMLNDTEERGSGGAISFNSPVSRQTLIKNNTLGQLTQTFVNLITNAKDQKIQIDQASKKLNIQKRRIYDITNVLEGIGYIQKTGKNQMKWVGGEQKGNQLEKQAQKLQEQIIQVQKKTNQAQNKIDQKKNELRQRSQQNEQLNFITSQDIQKLMKDIQSQQIFIYVGTTGDQLENDSNPQKKTSQCIIQSHTKKTKLFFCKMLQCGSIKVQQSIFQMPQSEWQQQQQKRQKSQEPQKNYLFSDYNSPLFSESRHEDESPQLFMNEFNIGNSILKKDVKKEDKQKFFNSDDNQ